MHWETFAPTGAVCSQMEFLKEKAFFVYAMAQLSMSKTGKILRGPANKPEPTFQVKIEEEQISISRT